MLGPAGDIPTWTCLPQPYSDVFELARLKPAQTCLAHSFSHVLGFACLEHARSYLARFRSNVFELAHLKPAWICLVLLVSNLLGMFLVGRAQACSSKTRLVRSYLDAILLRRAQANRLSLGRSYPT